LFGVVVTIYPINNFFLRILLELLVFLAVMVRIIIFFVILCVNVKEECREGRNEGGGK
jgi:hypothetical protein